MTGSAMTYRNGWPSFVLGLLTAAISVLLTQCLVLFVLAADYGDFTFETFFSFHLYVVVGVFALALATYVIVISFRKRRNLWLDVSVGKSYGWALTLVLVLGAVPVLSFALPELGGMYFGFAVFGFGIISATLGVPLAIALVTIGIGQYRKWLQTHTAIRSSLELSAPRS